MPRIKANTVAEHRTAQRRALLDAARELVLSGGPNALSFGELADRAGLARPSVYEYFKTKAELVVALMDEELPKWQEEIGSKLASVHDPERRIATFLRAHLELVSAGRHEVPFALAGADMDASTRAQVEARHSKALELLIPSLEQLALPPSLVLPLIGACLSAATVMVRGRRASRKIIDAAVAFVMSGLKAVAVLPGRSEREPGPRAKRSSART